MLRSEVVRYKIGDGGEARAQLSGTSKTAFDTMVICRCAEAEENKARWEDRTTGDMMERGCLNEKPDEAE